MRECPDCRTLIRYNKLEGLDYDIMKAKAQELIIHIQKAMEERQYSSAKEMLKTLSQINNGSLYNDEIHAFIKDMREKIFSFKGST